MTKIGIMQGRLSPAYDERLQFFPKDWRQEFVIARETGFDFIEWYNDLHRKDLDPQKDFWGNPKFLLEFDSTLGPNVVSSIDIGKYPVVGPHAEETLRVFGDIFKELAPRLFTRTVNLPLLENNAPKNNGEKIESAKTVRRIAQIARRFGIRIALETEMSALELAGFIEAVDAENVGVCYDIGNCTSYGVDCPKELEILGELVFEVHVKDRKVGSPQSVLLGTGDADFDGCFSVLSQSGYRGVYTLQAWRGEDYLADAKRQLQFTKEKLKRYE